MVGICFSYAVRPFYFSIMLVIAFLIWTMSYNCIITMQALDGISDVHDESDCYSH